MKTDTSISIHALLAESDLIGTLRTVSVKNFYPRSPCGERHQDKVSVPPAKKISIHALLAESDTVGVAEGADTGDISIHALLAESDF